MGLDNRDYIRHSQRQSAFGGGGTWPPVVKALLGINVTVFLIQLFTTPRHGDISAIQIWLQLDSSAIAGGQVWRLITSAFCHSTAQFLHIVFNMLLLVLFGRELERLYGSREFLTFYLIAAFVSALAFLGLNQLTGRLNPAIGASGAVMAVVVLFACIYPKREILIWFVLPLQIRWLVLIIVISDLLPALAALSGKNFETGIAHAAHLGGVAFGFLYWKAKVRLSSAFGKGGGGSAGQKKPKPKRPDLSIAGRSKPEIDSQVDALLQKISDKGFQSLTEKEKKFLEQASDKFGGK